LRHCSARLDLDDLFDECAVIFSIEFRKSYSEGIGVMYVQYGCGWTAPETWTNFDSSPTLRWERIPLIGRLYTKNAQRFPPNVLYGDIVKGLPISECSCSGVYASHVLEHLALNEFHVALDNTYKILGDGGIFRLVVPDLECAARHYLKKLESADASASSSFLEETSLGEKKLRRDLIGLLYSWLQTSRHLWMWDEVSLAAALQQHGFTRIRRCAFGDCSDPTFAAVEYAGRFERAVAIEARKPASL
jgi:hypothetical protein